MCIISCVLYGRRGRGQAPNPNFWKTMNKCFFIKGIEVFCDGMSWGDFTYWATSVGAFVFL